METSIFYHFWMRRVLCVFIRKLHECCRWVGQLHFSLGIENIFVTFSCLAVEMNTDITLLPHHKKWIFKNQLLSHLKTNRVSIEIIHEYVSFHSCAAKEISLLQFVVWTILEGMEDLFYINWYTSIFFSRV